MAPTLLAITAFLSRSPGLLNRGPGGPASAGICSHSRIFSPTNWTSCRRSYIIIWRPLFFLRATQFRTQFNPLTVTVATDLLISSTGCTCYLHRCISSFDSLAGSEVNMQQSNVLFVKKGNAKHRLISWKFVKILNSLNVRRLLHSTLSLSLSPLSLSL